MVIGTAQSVVDRESGISVWDLSKHMSDDRVGCNTVQMGLYPEHKQQ